MALGTLGTDPDYASLLGQRQDPRLLMAQKLMDVSAAPTTNASKSSFWANLLNQGARGALGGYLYNDVEADREKLRKEQQTEAGVADTQLQDIMKRLGGGDAPVKDGSGGTAPGTGTAPAAGGDAGGSPGGLSQAVHHLESRGRMEPGIIGDGGQAAGPMQVHAGALADVNRAQGTNYTMQDLTAKPEVGKAVGDTYLAQLRQQFGRDDYALGAYNAGPGAMRAAIANGQGVAGLPPKTQQYVAEGLARLRGRQADAGDAGPGSNLEALLAGVDAPKPRGLRLAENLVGGTATDAPTPILPPQPDPATGTASYFAALPTPPGTDPSQAPVPAAPPQPAPASAAPPPSPAYVPDQPLARADPATLANINGLPLPDLAAVPGPGAATTPPIAAAVPPAAAPALVPPPDAAAAGAPPPPALVPDNPLAGADPASLAAFNGLPQPTPAVVPPPDPAAVPTPPAATLPAPPVPDGGASRPDLPIPVPPIPPQGGPSGPQLAARLVSGGGGDNATEALNTASLAAARRGENFVPGGGTASGPDRDARNGPIDLFTQAGIPTPYTGAPSRGIQLAGPLLPPGAPGAPGGGGAGLVTPTGDTTAAGAPGATTDTSASGGPGKGAAAAAQASPSQTSARGLPDQAVVTEALTQAAQWKASSNPRVREKGIVLDTAATMAQRRIDRQDVLDQQLGARQDAASERAQTHQDTLELRRQAAADAAAGRAESAADRKERIRIENERLGLERDKSEQGRLQPGWTWADDKHTSQVPIPNGPADPKTLDANARREQIKVLAEKGFEPDPDKPGAWRKMEHGPADKPNIKHTTDSVTKGITGNMQLVQQIDDAADAVRKTPDAFGWHNLGGFADRFGTPESQAARERVANLANAAIYELSGKAVSAKEEERMQRSIPDQNQNSQQILTRLNEMRRIAMQRLQQQYDTYNPDVGYQAIPGHARLLGLEEAPTATQRAGGGSGAGAAPVRITDDAAGKQAMQSLKPGDQFIGPDGKLYTKGR